MTVLQAWVAMKAAILHLEGRELRIATPSLENAAYKSLRQAGMTDEDINSEFPEESVREYEEMIKTDPDKFYELIDESSSWLISRN